MIWHNLDVFNLKTHFKSFLLLCEILGYNCIQNFHLGRYIVGYTVRNLVLVKRDFRTYIPPYTSPNKYFEYGYPHSNALLQISLELERWKSIKPHAIQRDVT